jgi:hypothetical protein
MPTRKNQNNNSGNRGRSSNGGRSGSRRGLASADQETRERVARKGGEASHGGGRRSGNNS